VLLFYPVLLVSLHAGQTDSTDELQLPEGLTLPLQMDLEVAAFDAALREDADMRKALVRTLRFSCILDDRAT